MLSEDDCIKAAMVILESLSSKGVTGDRQILISNLMIQILKSSYVNPTEFKMVQAALQKNAENLIQDLVSGVDYEVQRSSS